jgi:protein-disulfide isomerase
MDEAVSYHAAMREGGFRTVGGLAQRLASGMARGRGTSIARLRADWPAIAGAELARITLPENMTTSRGGHAGAKSLRLRVAGSAALEVQHMREQLIDRVNGYFGHRTIDDIKLVQGAISQRPLPRRPAKPDPVALAAAEARVAEVKDPDLRAALARLGARITSSRRAVLLGLAGAFIAGNESRAQAGASAITEKDRVLGRATAPITILEYASLSCWACARFHAETLPPIKREWIDSGRAKLVFRHFPTDNVATRASHLVECLPPAMFFVAVEAVLRGQDQWTRAADPFAEAAKLAGQSPSQAKACQINAQPLNKVVSDVQNGQAMGVTSTPTIFINGQNHGNPGDPQTFDALLRKAH